MLLPAIPRRCAALLPARSSRCFGSLADRLQRPGARVHAFVSRSRDPYVNLSIEHYLLQKSAHDSVVLFLYANRPCIVVGRNQNPWLEVNLGLLRGGAVELVRRRSGGGAVFHDEGNLNWSVISPPAAFTRDKHAEMVVRALRRLGIERARVNERHDIVLDQGERAAAVAADDTHRTPFTTDAAAGPRPLKVSGSAYKLVRGRALHHGTCLLSSPNLAIIPQYLRSPAKPYIKGFGVESVSSPVSNIGIAHEPFVSAVHDEFSAMYGVPSVGPAAIELGDEQLQLPELRQGCDEMKTLDWTYLQTPKFTFSVPAQDQVPDAAPSARPAGLPPSTNVILSVHGGAIHEASVTLGLTSRASTAAQSVLHGLKLHEIGDWRPLLQEISGKNDAHVNIVADWLGKTLPSPQSQ
ncbi:lipoyltransferase and lipoate-protein ligase [Diplodia corticola]|uniref:Putative lipoate-protein ligase A n=1 Tax=Diplodia corticola TaxID=236234 RepID=A0A1J9S985_9PEZI|nr:lipoyltransferase and lipoate-protein ligase [Diplodia corticola]OJD36141.1 lipoyltransferase and lipoate-protein ligase [Diplodia corticola]